jgi:hypothetical protein
MTAILVQTQIKQNKRRRLAREAEPEPDPE